MTASAASADGVQKAADYATGAASSVVNHKYRAKIKRMDFFAGQGARRRHSGRYGNDEQRRPAEKDAVFRLDIYDSRH
jgi:hypothetical protein